MASSVKIAVLIFLSYFLVSVNLCAVTKGQYLYTAVSCVTLTSVNFFLMKRVVEARTYWEFGAYLVGGLFGDFAGIWFSKLLNIVS